MKRYQKVNVINGDASNLSPLKNAYKFNPITTQKSNTSLENPTVNLMGSDTREKLEMTAEKKNDQPKFIPKACFL